MGLKSTGLLLTEFIESLQGKQSANLVTVNQKLYAKGKLQLKISLKDTHASCTLVVVDETNKPLMEMVMENVRYGDTLTIAGVETLFPLRFE